MTWYIDRGPESDVIVSSRIRLARDLAHYPFPNRMDAQQAQQAADEVELAFYGQDESRHSAYLALHLDTLSEEDRMALAEKHLISEQLARDGTYHRVIISRDESVSIMINEEDHVRIQSMQAGLNLEEAYHAAAQVSLLLEQTLALAYNEKYGFLTACPTNTGTGMRASVMAHLPGLGMSGHLRNMIEGLAKMGFAVRGYYGEGSKSQGQLYQISNQLTLGFSEEDLISDLQRIVQQLIEQERKARQEIYRKRPLFIEDKIMRSYGILQQARLLATDEAMGMLSDLRLGIALGLVHGLTEADINRLQPNIGPAGIQKLNGRIMKQDERDQARARIVREAMQNPYIGGVST